MTSLFPPRESLVVTSRLGREPRDPFFYGVHWKGVFLDEKSALPAEKPTVWAKKPNFKLKKLPFQRPYFY
jgi:hypothetical protein